MTALAGVLPLATEEHLPSPELRGRIMAAVRADARTASPIEASTPWWQYLLRPVSVASAAMAVLVAVVAVTTWDSGGSSPDDGALNTALMERRLDLSHRGIEIMAQADTWWQFSGTGSASEAFGSLAFSENHGAACLVIYGLPGADDGASYLAAVSTEGSPAELTRMWQFESLVWLIIEGDPSESIALEITRVDQGEVAGRDNPVLFTIPLSGT